MDDLNNLGPRMLALNPWLKTLQSPVLLAISGGRDSVVLAHLFFHEGIPFELAHCNFQLRGADSDADESFVRRLADDLNIPVHVKRFLPDTARDTSIQEQARTWRYDWFESLRQERGCSFIATAHHAADNVETMVFRFFRGTGIRGLGGMEAKKGYILRPLLFATDNDLDAYAASHELSWRTDLSNFKEDYTRNYIRLQVIPGMEHHLPQVQKRLRLTQEKISEATLLYDQALEIHRKKLIKKVGAEIHMPIGLLLKTRPLETVLWEILRDFGFQSQQVSLAAQRLHQPNQQATFEIARSATHRLLKNRAWWLISPLQPEALQPPVLVEKHQTEALFSGGELMFKTLESVPVALSGEARQVVVDASKLSYPFVLRPWRTGDYFYPLGMKRKKKIARFLIDLRLSKTQKEKVWVLESNQRIVWVIGYRIDDRFKISSATTAALSIKVKDS